MEKIKEKRITCWIFLSMFRWRLKRNLNLWRTFRAFRLASASSFLDKMSLNMEFDTVLQSIKRRELDENLTPWRIFHSEACLRLKDKSGAGIIVDYSRDYPAVNGMLVIFPAFFSVNLRYFIFQSPKNCKVTSMILSTPNMPFKFHVKIPTNRYSWRVLH